MTTRAEWHEHLREGTASIRRLATGPEPWRAADYAEGLIAGLEWILGEADVEVPKK